MAHSTVVTTATPPLENLTRLEARERARLLRVESYDVTLDLTGAVKPDMATFPSRSVARFSCTEPGATTHVDITAETIVTATLNGEPIDVSSYDGRRLALPALAADNELVVEASCVYMRTGEGLHRFVDPSDGETYLYTQFEPFDAHRVYACFDQPDLKATFAFTVDTPPDWTVVSCMPAESSRDTGVDRWVFPATPRQSSYITAIVAGPYAEVRDEHDGIPLGIYCRQSIREHLDADVLFETTKQGFDFYHRIFGRRYAWPKYDQCFVAEYNAGAMENAGCVTILDDYVFRSRTTAAAYERRAVTVLHELAHMWFGDLVTMRWFDDLWLNESFAEWVSTLCAAEATDWREAWTTFCATEKTWAYRQDQLPTTHPIASDIPDVQAVFANFDGITYAKGASVLKQLVHYVGQDEFLAALRAYFARHEYGNTSLQDLLDAATEASGRDLGAWAKEWIETAGVNTLRPRFEVGPDGAFTSFAVVQEAPEEHPTLRTHRMRIGLYDVTDAGALSRRQSVDVEISGESTDVPALVGTRQPDLVLLNDDDLAYCKIRLDETSLATLVRHLGALDDSLARALCWGAAWDMCRDAEMAPGDYLELVLGAIGAEHDVNTVQLVLRLARQAIDPLGDLTRREERLVRYAEAVHGLMRAAETGSDLQLAFARAFAGAATSPEQVAVVRALLDGTDTVDGLTVDAELRWQLLGRLVVVGAADEAAIEAELARDDTYLGRRHALQLRAAVPTADAKAAAWSSAIEDDALTNADQAEVIAGFAPQEQRALTEPYVARYFEVVREAFESKTTEMAMQVAEGLFPATHVEETTVARADEWLAANADAPAALRRAIVEHRDSIQRALRCRARDTA